MIALIVLIIVAILVVAVVSLCAAGTIPVNAGIGIRMPSTRASETAWRVGHQAAYSSTLIGSTATIIACALGLVDSSNAELFTGVATAVLVVGLLWSAFRANRAAGAVVH